jgi:hypothetical protein
MLETGKKEETKKGSIKVMDLDNLLARDLEVILHGKVHTLNHIKVNEWLEAIAAETELVSLKDKDGLSPEDLINAYHNYISKVCKTITKEDLMKCSQQQIAGLWQLCRDFLSGYTEKKSLSTMTLMMMSLTPEEVQKFCNIIMKLQSMPHA